MNNKESMNQPEDKARVPSFYIGSVPVMGTLILAPMAGFSDPPFRSLCRAYGSSLSYTVFINAMDILNKWERTLPQLLFSSAERPVVFQLFDNDHDRILEAARRIEILEPDAIDINMGCSTRRVSGRGAGAGLLKDPAFISRIISSLTKTISVPVTAKIRLGWDHASLNYLDVARAIESSGGSAIAVHARTRDQAYHGKADWEAISHIKDTVSIPVIGNGDVRSVQDIDRLKESTNCDGVMIGRAAIGNPWIFQSRERTTVSNSEAASVITNHLDSVITYYGELKGIELFRKHLVRYLSPDPISRHQRQHLLTRNTRDELASALNNLGYPIQFP